MRDQIFKIDIQNSQIDIQFSLNFSNKQHFHSFDLSSSMIVAYANFDVYFVKIDCLIFGISQLESRSMK